MKINTLVKVAILAVAVAVTVPAYAGIAAPGNESDGAFAGISGAAAKVGDVDVVLNGPATSDEYVGKSGATTDFDSHAKSLSAFSNGTKTFDWNWPGWPGWPGDGGDGCPGTVVPEPSTMALLGIGLGAIAVRRRNSKKS